MGKEHTLLQDGNFQLPGLHSKSSKAFSALPRSHRISYLHRVDEHMKTEETG